MDEDFGEDILERGVAIVHGKKRVKAHNARHSRNYDWRWDPVALERHREKEDIETGKVTWAAAQKAGKKRKKKGKVKAFGAYRTSARWTDEHHKKHSGGAGGSGSELYDVPGAYDEYVVREQKGKKKQLKVTKEISSFYGMK